MNVITSKLISRPSPAWRRAGLDPRFVKLGPKEAPKFEMQIGAGAFGRVYRAYDHHSQSFVAVKKIVGEGAIQVALGEYRLGSQLQHPSLVSTLALGVSPKKLRPKAYLVTRLVEGMPVSMWGTYPRQAICDCMAALHYLHARNVAHNDIHSDNILVGFGRGYLIDLGQARKIGSRERQLIRADIAGLLGVIEAGLFKRSQTHASILGGEDALFAQDFEDLKACSWMLAWRRDARPPTLARMQSSAFFGELLRFQAVKR